VGYNGKQLKSLLVFNANINRIIYTYPDAVKLENDR